ncbi:MAG: MFS transporter, partial [SAR202 cluster bacterium]|nr:MFS transporter [SAR202 cluster bacterium]
GINQAVPRIATHFNATIPDVQWIVLAYLLTVGTLLLPIGRLSDMIGHRKVYLAGVTVFALGGLLSGFSQSVLMLVLLKVMQGAGAAMIQATGLPIITSAFPSSQRGRAIGAFVGVLALGAIFGPVVGGGVVTVLDWRWFFFMSVPIGLVSVVAALRVLGTTSPLTHGGQAMTSAGRFDWMGAGMATGALTLLLLIVTQGNNLGWLSPLVIGGFIAVAVLATAFVIWELRCAHPLMPMALFKNRTFQIGQAAMFFTVLGNSVLFFLIPFYLQDVLGLSPVLSGTVIAAVPLAFITAGPLVGTLSDRWGWRRFVPFGLAFACIALVLLSRVTLDSPLALVVASLALMGLGLGFIFSPSQNAVYGTVEPDRQGVVTAFINMARNTGQLSSIAVGTAIVTATMGSLGYEASLDVVKEGDLNVAGAFITGMSRAYLTGAIVLFIGFLISLAPGKTQQPVHVSPGSPIDEQALPEP